PLPSSGICDEKRRPAMRRLWLSTCSCATPPCCSFSLAVCSLLVGSKLYRITMYFYIVLRSIGASPPRRQSSHTDGRAGLAEGGLADDVGDRFRRGFNSFARLAFYHHSQYGLGARRTQQHPALAVQRALDARARVRDRLVLLPVETLRHFHVQQHLRVHDEVGGELGERFFRDAHGGQHLQ